MLQSDLKLFQSLTQYLLSAERDHPVAEPIEADQLFDRLDLSLSEDPITEDQFQKILFDLVQYTPKTSSKLFFNQLFAGRQSKAMLGDLLAVMLNNSMYTYKVAGPMVGIEKSVLNQVCQIIGYPAEADGTFASGGSMTNLMAMLMARDRCQPSIREAGVHENLIAYTSRESHYSIQKNAMFIGIGMAQVRKVDSDAQGRMLASHLRELVDQDRAAGSLPFFVNATAGTTVLGAFDPLEDIQQVCEKQDLWLHVDGAYCGAVIFSEKYRHLVAGLQNSDSFSFNAHKMLNTTLTCSLLVTRDKKYLYDSFAVEADYLYQTDADEYNLGKTSLQCGRRNDALKLWTMWKAGGQAGLAKLIDNQFYLADVAREYVRNHPDYTLYSFDNSLSICFNYKSIPADELCTALYEGASLMVGHGTFQDQTFVRLVTINASNNKEDILTFFEELEKFANKT